MIKHMKSIIISEAQFERLLQGFSEKGKKQTKSNLYELITNKKDQKK